jgi:hypothetical protein
MLANYAGIEYNNNEVVNLLTPHKQEAQETSVKYTAVLPRAYVIELKALAGKKIIPSVNQGIRLAVENFVAFHQQQEYELALQAAAADQAFIKRTLDTQEDFSAVDAEGENPW